MRDPINPADIRVGDRVERVSEERGVETIILCVITRLDGGIIHAGWLEWSVLDDGQWYLLERPDPLAEAVEVAAKAQWVADDRAFHWSQATGDTQERYRKDARVVVAAIAERWDLVPKKERSSSDDN